MNRKAFTLIELIVVLCILGVVGFVAISVIGGGGCNCMSGTTLWTQSTAVITVNNKYVIAGADGASNTYRVEATTPEGDEVFEIRDTILAGGQYRSADFFAQLKNGHQYEVECRGYRSGQWSQFRNIVKILREVPLE